MFQELTDGANERENQNRKGKHAKGRDNQDTDVQETVGGVKQRAAACEPIDQDQLPGGTADGNSARELQDTLEGEVPNQVEELAQRYLNQQYRNYYNQHKTNP